MRVLLLAVAVGCCVSAEAQVSVSESGIRAHQVNGITAITLPVRNSLKGPLRARVELKWLDPEDKVDEHASQRVELASGSTSIEIPLPIGKKMAPLEDRLSYEIEPDYENLTRFDRITGILSFMNIADFAFTTRVLTLDGARPGVPYEVRVLTMHPVTGRPVAGVNLVWGPTRGVTDENGMAVLSLDLGDDEELPKGGVYAKLGDFEQNTDVNYAGKMRPELTIQFDKPIYQPGQTMHLRILSIGANRKAVAGREYELKIENDDKDVEHAAKITTSKYGIAATDWAIPANAEAGKYKIRVESDDPDDDAEAGRDVTIRKYELPTFRVKARGVRGYYLPEQRATLEVSAEYLFGKPVTSGTVKITEGDDEDGDDFASGRLDANGVFRTSFLVEDELSERERFHDRHFIAFVTDSTTNRTEQKKFDVRISRADLHVYFAKDEWMPSGRRIYATTYSPDGTPVKADLEVWSGKRVVGRGRSNRYGVARLDIGPVAGELRLRAKALDGRRAEEEGNLFDIPKEGVWLTTEHAIYKPGETIHGQIESTRKNIAAQLVGWNKQQQVVFSQTVRLTEGKSQFEIPYAKNFGREFSLAAVVGPLKQAALESVIFPGPDDLEVKAAPAVKTYQPGGTAHLEFTASSQAALGIAVVDQSVMERADTDEAFGRRRWFYEDRSERVSGVSYNDLLRMDPANIDPDIELLAEILRSNPTFLDESEDAVADVQAAYKTAAAKKLVLFKDGLDALYVRELAYPHDEGSYTKLVGNGRLDPWQQLYRIRFSVDKTDDVMELCSDGPDKLPKTDDDFCLWEIRRPWFARYGSLIRDALDRLEDYPETKAGAFRVLESTGIQFGALRDPWRSPLRLSVRFQRDQVSVFVSSAGADQKFGTADDFTVAAWSGSYFLRRGRKIQQKVEAAKDFPQTEAGLFALAKAAGVDLSQTMDPWGHAYYVTTRSDANYYDKVSFYTYGEYGKEEETRKRLTPARRNMLITELRSAGPDGKRGTWDDFAVYTFTRLTDEPAEPAKQPAKRRLVAGKGMIFGTVSDESGAMVPNVTVTLDDDSVAYTNGEGKYSFLGLPAGIYNLRFESPGFQMGQVAKIKVRVDLATRYDFVMHVATSAEIVEVTAQPTFLQTESSSVISAQQVAGLPVSTPRVREYFPETLYWQPELVTDESGHATLDVRLADTITTWHVAVMASTIDGKVTETETEVRAFQPFQVDLDVPPVLTVGDQLSLPVPIRNYSDQMQQVTVKATAEAGFTVRKVPVKPLAVAKDAAAKTVLDLHADTAADKTRLEVSAVGGTASDAIAKTSWIHPDGERKEKSVTTLWKSGQSQQLEMPAGAISGSVQAEVKVYPSILARLLESIESVLQQPGECGEQTISSSYPNLLVLQALKRAGLQDERIESRARKNLDLGYERLLGYQSDAGGFEYWHGREPDAALTAYALQFLRELTEFREVDDKRLKKAMDWLRKQTFRDRVVPPYAIRALVAAGADEQVLKALTGWAQDAAMDDPYALAVFAEAALDAHKPELAEPAVHRLIDMAQDEKGSAYWALRANTVFHGWGRSGMVETTGMVLSALSKWRTTPKVVVPAELDSLLDRGVIFLLRNTNRYGVWGSGQATVQALTALVSVAGRMPQGEKQVEVVVNGAVLKTITVRESRALSGPIAVDISKGLHAGTNEVMLRSADAGLLETQLNAVWYEPWAGSHTNKDFSLEAKFSQDKVRVNENVKCSVTVSRPLFRGYGMMIAEVGLPPGAEVDRGSLEATLGKVDSYEVAPDHVTFYIWPQAKDLQFDFTFRPRFGMKARMAESVLYDYYNPDARAVLAPGLFTAK